MVDMKIADHSRWSDQFHKTNITTKKKQGQIKLGDEFCYKEQKSRTKTKIEKTNLNYRICENLQN